MPFIKKGHNNNMDYAIETNSLTKHFGNKTAVNNISLHVRKGDIYGLIGKNGAGKTTLMKLLLGLEYSDSGMIKIMNNTNLDKARRKIGSLIEAPGIYKNETAYENLKRFSIIAPTSDKDIIKILQLVGLGDTGGKKAGDFSLGMRQRLGIAIALLGRPDILILDEPINGLDPAGIKQIRDIILRLNKKGVTFLISSHLLDELGKIATNYGIVANGILVEEISANELNSKCHSSLKITTDNIDKTIQVLQTVLDNFKYNTSKNTIYITSEIADNSQIAKILIDAGIRIYELYNESMGFEDFFIERLGK